MKKVWVSIAVAATLGLPACGGHATAAPCDGLRAKLQQAETRLDSMPSGTNAQIAAYNRQVAVANTARAKATAASCNVSDI